MSSRQAFSPTSAPPNLQHHRSFSSSSSPMLGGVVIAIIILFVAGWLCFCFRRKLFANFRLWRRQKGNLDAAKMKLRRFRLEELQKATNNFSQSCLVGCGAFGNVYRGTFEAEGTLAIKKPHAESYTSTEEFRNEVKLLSKVKHDNLVGLVGFCEETGPKAAKILVYEYVTNGSLLDYIMGRGGRILTWRERVKIAIGAAKGIAHLHEGISPSIIHRDIKPSNILIGEGYEAKVSDFGLVRSGPVGDQSHVSSQVKGTPGYLDPAYCSSFHLTPFTDVYSFGVILLQLVAARPAVESSRSNASSHIIDWDIRGAAVKLLTTDDFFIGWVQIRRENVLINENLVGKARPSIEKGNIEDILDTDLLIQGCNMQMMLKMGQLALRCVVKVPKERPTMTQVWQELEAALKSVDDHLLLPAQPLDEDSPTLMISTTDQAKSRRINQLSSTDHDYSCSIVSVDGIGLERFHVDIDSMSFQSASLRCLETSISMDEGFSIIQ